ncbi:MAG: baseplate J/gp47 family protein [Bacteroidota bacterium]
MSDCTENTLIKSREGTTQQERYLSLLDPNSVELMGFKVKDWMNFAEEFSKHVQLYDKGDYKNPSGTWEPFHNASAEIKEVIETYAEGDITPQLALFIAFLKLLNKSKERFNGITKRHLDFYYHEVLQFKKNDEKADHAYVIFELAKNASEQFLSDETLVKAGKDSNGTDIHYKLEDEIVLNKAKIAALRNTYAYNDESNWHASNIANSADGEGGEAEDGNTSWLPFGDTDRGLAKKGFSLSAPSLLLSEGVRTITINAACTSLPSGEELRSILKIEHTGEKGWVELPFASITKAQTITNAVEIVIELTEDDEKIANYDAEIHEGKYDTTHPIIRVLFSKEDTSLVTYDTYLLLANAALQKITITTTGTYTENITVKNDLGKIKTENPFYPFGTQAKKRASLRIGSDEWIGKRISNVKVSLSWKDRPDNFEDHYKLYLGQYVNLLPNQTFLSVYNDIKDDASKWIKLVTGADGENRFLADASYIGASKTGSESVANAVSVDKEAEAARKKSLPNQFPEERRGSTKDRRWYGRRDKRTPKHTEEQARAMRRRHTDRRSSVEEAPSPATTSATNGLGQRMFNGFSDVTFTNFLPQNTTYVPKKSDEYFIELSLQNDFLYDAFPKIYTYHALEKLALPNAAYAPFAEKLSVIVTTEETIGATKNEVQLYHELPFGINKVKRSDLALVATPENGGQLYIGIEEAIADQNIQLLCQIEEGSENPDAIETYDKATVTWQYLHNNSWNNLKPSYLLKDQTDDFLKAGLVAFTVPKQFGDNTLFAEDYLWIRATISKPFDTVSKFANIHTQAVAVKFVNNDNTLEHLDNGMPAETLTKLEDRLATVKKVMQPYASFEGCPKESDLDFYRRVSERLRHKNRAITLWDYEHLVLQEFNYLHKIKCLNHSTSTSFKAPGEVVLVAIPNIIDQNVYDIYKPKLSQTKLNAIENYINQLNTMHVAAKVVSPVYEPVQITLSARFYKGLDANFYAKKLQEDLAQYLAPWAFDKNQPISFGNALYSSEVIFYIENLDYVDYIKDFKMVHKGSEEDEIIPKDQKSILTSVVPELHAVTAITTEAC